MNYNLVIIIFYQNMNKVYAKSINSKGVTRKHLLSKSPASESFNMHHDLISQSTFFSHVSLSHVSQF